jgi:hypothetical protein
VSFIGFLRSTKYGRTLKVGNKDKKNEMIGKKQKQKKFEKDKMR